MKQRSRLFALAAIVASAGLGVFVESGIGGDDAVPVADSLDIVRAEPATVSPRDLELVDVGPRLGAGASKRRKAPKPFYYVSVETFVVQPNTADIREIRCPVGQAPVTGGVLAPTPGLAVTNSSRTNPNGSTLSGAWYEQVTNFTAVELSWRVHLTCLG